MQAGKPIAKRKINPGSEIPENCSTEVPGLHRAEDKATQAHKNATFQNLSHAAELFVKPS
jgi:hypothetical protein